MVPLISITAQKVAESRPQNALQTSMERLSSGLAQAQRNANDGISIAQTAEASGIAALDETDFTTMTTFTEVREYTDEDGNTAYAAIG